MCSLPVLNLIKCVVTVTNQNQIRFGCNDKRAIFYSWHAAEGIDIFFIVVWNKWKQHSSTSLCNTSFICLSKWVKWVHNKRLSECVYTPEDVIVNIATNQMQPSRAAAMIHSGSFMTADYQYEWTSSFSFPVIQVIISLVTSKAFRGHSLKLSQVDWK